MLDLQFGRHSRCAAVAVACQVLAVVGLAGCKKAPSAPSAQEAPPASAPEASSPQAVESAADGSMAPPDEFLRQCMRVQMADGSLMVSATHARSLAKLFTTGLLKSQKHRRGGMGGVWDSRSDVVSKVALG